MPRTTGKDNKMKEKKILLTGGTGMVGSSIARRLTKAGYSNVLTPTRQELDLFNQEAVNSYFESKSPDVLIDAAAKVGGMKANNTYRGEFIYGNLQIQLNLIQSAFSTGVDKLIFLGSSCIYPKEAPQPIKEEYLLTGPLEYTNEPYAVAKIAGVKMCESYYKQWGCNYLSLMPCNQYGPNDNFDLETSHVLPALMRKFHEAARRGDDHVNLWGTGKALREFQYIDDLADACLHVLENISAADIYDQNISHLNVGTGEETSIGSLAEKIAKVTSFNGELRYEPGTSDGTLRKVMDVSRLTDLGWKNKISLDEGLPLIYKWFKDHVNIDYASV